MGEHESEKSLTFDRKVVLVTGSGTGIGKAIAKKFAKNGASIIILGRRSEPLENTATELKEAISEAGSAGTVRIFPGVDVSEENSISEMFDTIKREFGNIDILVNNAGVSGPVKLFTNCSLPSSSTLPSLTFILNFAPGRLNIESEKYAFN